MQQDIEAGLGMFRARLASTSWCCRWRSRRRHQTERVLREMSDVGVEGIVSFPNFGHWSHAWSILRGRMPVSRELPYQWYDTPNLHLTTIRGLRGFPRRGSG